jgi:hypothetical protein
MRRSTPASLLLAALLLAACAAPGPEPAAPTAQPAGLAAAPDQVGGGWHPVLLPGKEATSYRWTSHDGRLALAASSAGSASLWRRKVALDAERVGSVRFAWWVDGVIAGASVADVTAEDAPARVIFAFGGDESKLPQRTRMQFDLAEALTGERPPYATLMYVYESSAPPGSVIVNPRSDRVRKIVLDSGVDQLRRWRDHQRDLRADFRAAFGEDPGPLVAVALMTDSDNTRSRASAWYSPPDFD